MTDDQKAVSYQMTTLTPGLADRLIRDSSPATVAEEMWPFLNNEIMTANLTQIDIENIMDMTDIQLIDMLTGIHESKWNNFAIVEKQWDKDPADPTGQRMKVIAVRTYPITELWDALRAKVYIKCCNSRGGHLLKTLTENRSSINQVYEERGTGIATQQPQGQAMPQQESGGWRP
jgi:hypothetical protein